MFIILEIDEVAGGAQVWVSYSKKNIADRIYQRKLAQVAAGSPVVQLMIKDHMSALQSLAVDGLQITLLDIPNAIAYVLRRDPFYFTLYEALRDHGAIPPPYVVSWYDLPASERSKSLMVNLAHASIWNGVEAERYAQDQAAAGRHDVTISEYCMFGKLICERPPPNLDNG
jgi:hypothetical protein